VNQKNEQVKERFTLLSNRAIDEQPPQVVTVGTLNIGPREKQLVLEALDNNRLSYGPMSQRFEAEFANAHNCRFGVISNSGTSALQIALQTLKELHGWEDGDEVIVPAVTFVATANIVLHNRMNPVLVDVEPDYYELNPELLAEKMSPRTRAIIPVHLFGHPADMDPILNVASRARLKVIEDSAQTAFVSYGGRMVGSLGDIGCFSTYVAHLLNTRVGGLSIANDPEYAIHMRSLVNHGRDSIYVSIDDDDDVSDEQLRLIVARRFKFISIGHSYRVTEMEAALGLGQLEGWHHMIAARRANAEALSQKLAHWEAQLQLPKVRPGSTHSFMMFPIVLREEPKTELANFLERNGVETRDMLPLTNQPVYERLLGWREMDYPVAKWINNNGLYVGCHQDLTDIDLDYIVELFERFFRRRPMRVSDEACLFIISSSGRAVMERVIQEVPRELFARVIVVDTGLEQETIVWLNENDIQTWRQDKFDIVYQVANTQVEIEEENLVFFNADEGHNPRDIGRLLLMLERGNDMVIASRFMVGGGRFSSSKQAGRYRSIGNRVFNLLANMFFYGNFTDCLTQYRAVKRSKLVSLKLSGKKLDICYRLSIQALKQGWRVGEIPTTELVRPSPGLYKEILLSIVPVMWTLLSESLLIRARSDSV
jgi:dTDP-4-amino-4,6-dideoxygalactose transaminase